MKRVKDHRYLYRRAERLYFRRSVPVALREAFGGQTEVICSLGTADLAPARHLLARELAKFERTAASAGNFAGNLMPAADEREPSLIEIDAAVRIWLAERRDRYHLDFANADEAQGLELLAALKAQLKDAQRSLGLGGIGPSLSVQWLLDAVVERNGWRVDPRSRVERHLHQRFARAQAEAAHEQITELEGVPYRPLDEIFSPEQYRLDEERQRGRVAGRPPVSLAGLYERYLSERKPSPATAKSWKRVVPSLTEFLKHDDARSVSADDVVAWKNHLLQAPNAQGRPIAPQTVRETYLAAIRVVFRWALENREVEHDPTENVGVRVPRANRKRLSKGLDDREAAIILRGTFQAPPPRLTADRCLARRWVPWLCAYTGARVNEITQLRAEDVQETDGVWAMLITPEAGSTKDGRARLVPLHSHLIDQGFLTVIRDCSGPLFYDPKAHKGGSDGNPHYKKTGEHLARWVRKLGVDDEDVAPNHGWRHRFKTQARRVRMQEDIRDAIQGHVPRTEGEGYGDHPMAAMLREIERLPRYEIRAAAE